MRITRRTAVMIAVVCAAAAALLMVVYLRSLAPTQPAPQPQVETVAVPVPVAALAIGTRLTSAQLTTKHILKDSLPTGAILTAEELEGQVLSADAPAGQPILRTQLVAYTPQAGLAFVVPDGMRAVTVAVDNISGVSDFLKLGDRVDVLATFEAQQQAITRTILQDIEVLGLGAESVRPQAPSAEGEAPAETEGQSRSDQPPAAGVRPSATLAVTPQQAQVLVLAANKGKLHLALRPKSDNRMVAMPPSSNQTVIGVELTAGPPPAPGAPTPPPAAPTAVAVTGERAGLTAAPVAGPAVPRGPTVEVFRGVNREVVTP